MTTWNYEVWKYKLLIADLQTVAMPEDAQILSVGKQNDTLCLWALVSPNEPLRAKRIEIIGTGNPIFEPSTMVYRKFIGTVIMDPHVWHVFERPY